MFKTTNADSLDSISKVKKKNKISLKPKNLSVKLKKAPDRMSRKSKPFQAKVITV